MGKSFDGQLPLLGTSLPAFVLTHARVYSGWLPLGPCLVASSQIKNPQDMTLKTHLAMQSASLNPLQNGSTKEQLWQIAETVSALSYGTLLKKGDIICTGTPPGQGSSQKPPIWLQHGETVTVYGEGIGSLVNEVAWESKKGRQAKL